MTAIFIFSGIGLIYALAEFALVLGGPPAEIVEFEPAPKIIMTDDGKFLMSRGANLP